MQSWEHSFILQHPRLPCLPLSLFSKTSSCFIRFHSGYKYSWLLSVCLGYCFITRGKQKQSKHPRRGNSPGACKHPQSNLNKARAGTPWRKPSMMQRKINVEKYPKGKRADLECCYCWSCLQVMCTISGLRRNFRKTAFLGALLFSFSQNPPLMQMFLFQRTSKSDDSVISPMWPRPAPSLRLPTCFFQ